VAQSERGGAALRMAVALAVLAAGYLGMAWFLGRHVPANTSVAGVPIGGKAPADAEATLKRVLASRASAPIMLRLADRTVEIDPSAAGLALDLKGTLSGLSGFSAKPSDVWNHLTGGQDEPLETTVDEEKLTRVLAETAKSVDRSAHEGSITFPEGKVAVVAPEAGRRLDVERTADVIADTWPTTTPVQAVVDVVEPQVSAAEITRARTEFADKAMSGPVKVVIGKTQVPVAPAAYAPALAMKPSGSGRLEPDVDEAKLAAAVLRAAEAAGVETKARDARIVLSGGTPTVLPSATGVRLDDASLEESFVAALTSATRLAQVKTTVLQPELTTAEAKRIAPREVISTFTTYFPNNPPRTNNIRIAARTLNGTYVGPGEQFSLNKTLGQRTPAKGYAQAPVIINGRLVKDYGGGVSQVSTTVFNAAFFSGVRIEEFLPHSFYIPRYPEGREATVSWPNVDQKWTNDSGYGILIQAYTAGNALTVTFHGVKVWEIEAVKGPRRNVVQPKTITDDRPTCVPQSPSPGFDVTVTRVFKKNGRTVRTSQFNTHYIPEDKVTCTHPDAA
jgi:vancomycin resistance protein YoaR